jgi:hypothetical protein
MKDVKPALYFEVHYLENECLGIIWGSILGVSVARGVRQRQRGHQSFWETSLLSKPAATQQTQVQRLSPENKGGFSYVLFRAGYRNGGYSLSHT